MQLPLRPPRDGEQASVFRCGNCNEPADGVVDDTARTAINFNAIEVSKTAPSASEIEG